MRFTIPAARPVTAFAAPTMRPVSCTPAPAASTSTAVSAGASGAARPPARSGRRALPGDLGQVVLDALELADRATELLPLVGVLHRQVDRLLQGARHQQ